MNPSGERLPNFEVPQAPSPESDELGQEQAAEAPAAAPEKARNKPSQPAALPTVPDDIPTANQPVIAAPPQDLANPLPSNSSAPTNDPERIEPIWITKAKDIEMHTKDDPFLQKDQMSRVKAEYIQKRFNKTIKTDEVA